MSKKITRWKCDVCGACFSTKEEADKCEKAHIGIAKAEANWYGRERRYPTSVRIEFDDGQWGLYELSEGV